MYFLMDSYFIQFITGNQIENFLVECDVNAVNVTFSTICSKKKVYGRNLA